MRQDSEGSYPVVDKLCSMYSKVDFEGHDIGVKVSGLSIISRWFGDEDNLLSRRSGCGCRWVNSRRGNKMGSESNDHEFEL
jgi:hypothetical protein